MIFAVASVADAAGGDEVAEMETNPGHPPPIGGRPKSGRRDHSPARRGASNPAAGGPQAGVKPGGEPGGGRQTGGRPAASRTTGGHQAGRRSP